ncbi:MAG: hypothetical protein U0M06_02580 [Clostridia bacterium]|nr:hypothetical protein [Clostridia bacterium]
MSEELKTSIKVEGIIQLFRKTIEEWMEDTTVIKAGEPALLLDENGNTIEIRIGNGKDRFIDLPSQKTPADQTYNPESVNAQSGIAVAKALQGYVEKEEGKGLSSNNFTDDYKNKLDLSNNLFANAIKPKLTGKVIKADDVSPIEHELRVKIKNFFDITRVNQSEKITINQDNEIIIDDPNYGPEPLNLGKLEHIAPDLKGGDTISLSYWNTNSTNSLGLYLGDGSGLGSVQPVNFAAGGYLTVTLPDDISDVYVKFSSGNKTHLLSNIIITCGEATNLSEVNVSRYGKNLITHPYYNTSKTDRGITFTVNEDKTITANGTAESTLYFIIRQKDLALSKGTYYCSGCPVGGNATKGYAMYAVVFKNGVETKIQAAGTLISRPYDLGNGFKFEIPDEGYTISVVITINQGATVNNLVFKPQIEVGESRTEYKPYIAPQNATADADGVVKGLTSISPNMTLFADKDVTLECEYIADTKLYIDNKIVEAAKALLNS